MGCFIQWHKQKGDLILRIQFSHFILPFKTGFCQGDTLESWVRGMDKETRLLLWLISSVLEFISAFLILPYLLETNTSSYELFVRINNFFSKSS